MQAFKIVTLVIAAAGGLVLTYKWIKGFGDPDKLFS